MTKYINLQIEEILQAQTSQIQGKTHLETQYKLRTKEKEKNTKNSQRRRHITFNTVTMKWTADSSTQIMKAKDNAMTS